MSEYQEMLLLIQTLITLEVDQVKVHSLYAISYLSDTKDERKLVELGNS
jgi:hypothetical protein